MGKTDILSVLVPPFLGLAGPFGSPVPVASQMGFRSDLNEPLSVLGQSRGNV